MNVSSEPLSEHNVEILARLSLLLWPECEFKEEYENCQKMLFSQREMAFLCKNEIGEYIAFIMLALRYEYVEGTNSFPIGYVEGIWVHESYRKHGIGKHLVKVGEQWCKSRGCQEMASDAELHNTTSQAFHESLGFEEVNRIVCYRKDL